MQNASTSHLSDPARCNISVVIPTYKRPEDLRRLLTALVAQTQSSSDAMGTEILVVDNCPDASANKTVVGFSDAVSYIHEPEPGVVHARNRGIREAEGDFILFIDDDEIPCDNWLADFLNMAEQGKDAVFGPVEPLYDGAPQEHLKPALDRLFSRRIPAKNGDDVSHLRALLGTGNSMFRRDACFDTPAPFDQTFNDGGEDVALLKKLVLEKSIRLTWCASARVDEFVPASRMEMAYVKRRIFNNGRLRCRVEYARNDVQSISKVAFWMGVGCAQVILYGCLALALKPFNKTKSTDFELRRGGGLGKILWWTN